MRTIIDLPEHHVKALEAICRREGISRAEAIRRLVAEHLSERPPQVAHSAFGVWRRRKVDGLEFERRARREWDRPSGR